MSVFLFLSNFLSLLCVLQSAAKFEKEFGGVAEPLPEPTIPDISCLRIPELYLIGQEGNTQAKLRGEKREESNHDVISTRVAAGGGDGTSQQQRASAPAFEKKQEVQLNEAKHIDDDGVTFAWEELDTRNK
jgi:hypothetical protein